MIGIERDPASSCVFSSCRFFKCSAINDMLTKIWEEGVKAGEGGARRSQPAEHVLMANTG